jgi:hypothetical protein
VREGVRGMGDRLFYALGAVGIACGVTAIIVLLML